MVRVFGVLNWPKKMSWHLFKRPNWCGLRISLTCLILITLCIVAPIIIWEEVTRPRGNQAQSIGEMWMHRMKRDMMEVNLTGQVTLVFKEGQIGTNQIDLCQVLRCGLSGGGRSGGVRKAPVYLCIASLYGNERCPSWKLALWNTGADWGYSPPNHMKCKSTKRRLKLTRGVEPSSCSQNQLCNPIRITLQDPQKCDEGRYTLGIYTSGRGNNMEYLHIQVLQKEEPRQTIDLTKVSPVNRTVPSQVIYLEPDRLIDTFEIETGYAEKNIWLEWMLYTAASMEMSNCIACSTARPSMATVPFKLNQQNDEKGLKCMLQLFQQIAPVSNCTALHYLYPPVSRIQPPQFMMYPGNFTCFNRTGQNSRISVGQAPYCSDIIHVGSKEYPDTLFSNHLVGRADIWWYCGGKQVRQVLPSLWGGICTLIQLAQPFYILPDRSAGMMWITEKNLKRARRSVPKGSFDDRIYIDSIGIPRGVPDEFKARNQVAAGFETIISWWVTINKNVDWINYIYYNQQRFVNYTRDAVQGLAEQLDRTSLMAWQNRIALDMLLAKEGGVCKMFGTACCTFIPNNTAPDGSVTKALEGLTALSNELVENSGINDPLSKWLQDTFGKWAAYIRGILITVGTVLTLIILLGCCVIPCIRGLVNKVVDQAVTQQYLIETIPLTQGESDSYLDHDIDDV